MSEPVQQVGLPCCREIRHPSFRPMRTNGGEFAWMCFRKSKSESDVLKVSKECPVMAELQSVRKLMVLRIDNDTIRHVVSKRISNSKA